MIRTITAAALVGAGAAIVGVVAVAISAGALAIAAVAALVAAVAAVVLGGAILAIGGVVAAVALRALARRTAVGARSAERALDEFLARRQAASLARAHARAVADAARAEIETIADRVARPVIGRWQPRRMAVMGALSAILMILLVTGVTSARVGIPKPSCDATPDAPGCYAPPDNSNANPDAGGPPAEGPPGQDGSPGNSGNRP